MRTSSLDYVRTALEALRLAEAAAKEEGRRASLTDFADTQVILVRWLRWEERPAR